jgi:hypothetical protein
MPSRTASPSEEQSDDEVMAALMRKLAEPL